MSMALIDMIVRVAHQLDADSQSVSPKELHEAYLESFPGETKGRSREGFTAELSFHCINMPARFFDPSNPTAPDRWNKRPLFKRLKRGQYMLLSEEEVGRFQQCLADNHPLVYAPEYDVADLIS